MVEGVRFQLLVLSIVFLFVLTLGCTENISFDDLEPIPDSTVPPVQKHKECVDDACVEVDGAGEDSCSTNKDCAPPFHYACVEGTCDLVEGVGNDECENDEWCYLWWKKTPEFTGKKGHIYDDKTKELLSGVNIRIANRDFDQWVKTDANGYFELATPPGDFTIFFQKKGYEYHYEHEPIRKDETLWNKLYLEPVEDKDGFGWKVGKVYDQKTGKPLKNAVINFVDGPENVDHGERTEYTDPQGYFEFQLPKGKYTLSVQHEGYYSHQEQFLEIKEGKTIVNTIYLEPVVTGQGKKMGRVYDIDTEEPLAGVNVNMRGSNNYDEIVTTDENGYFEFYAPHTYYSIQFLKDGYMYWIEQNIEFSEEYPTKWNKVFMYPNKDKCPDGTYDTKKDCEDVCTHGDCVESDECFSCVPKKGECEKSSECGEGYEKRVCYQNNVYKAD